MRIFQIICSIIMLAVTNIIYAQNFKDEDSGFFFITQDAKSMISGYDWSSNKSFDELTGHLVFPKEVYGEDSGTYAPRREVWAIYWDAFKNCEKLRSISFPNTTLFAICQDAFSGCKNLTTVNNLSVYHLLYNAFSYCKNLSQITLPNVLRSIGKFCFSGCDSLKKIIIPKSVESIEYGAFYQCSNLNSLEILSDKISELDNLTFA